MRVAQRLFDTAGAFDARDGMFGAHPHARDGAIVPFLGGRQFFATRLFFGCCVCTLSGS